jgi:hypothetical protein
MFASYRRRPEGRDADPSATGTNLWSMLIARMLCSDPGCADEREIVVARLTELDGACCECGFGLVVTSISQVELRPARH